MSEVTSNHKSEQPVAAGTAPAAASAAPAATAASAAPAAARAAAANQDLSVNPVKSTRWGDMWASLCSNKAALLGMIIIAILVTIAVVLSVTQITTSAMVLN